MKNGHVDTLKVAIIGLGRWGNSVAEIVHKTPGLSIATCFTRTETKREAFAENFGCDQDASLDAVVSRDDVDALIITAPNHKHREITEAAAANGKHVFVDKPVATTIEDARAMIQCCTDAGVTLAIGASARRLRGYRVLKKLIEDGEVGVVALAEANYSNDRGLHYTPDDWQWYANGSPGGPLMQVAIHQVDNLYYLFGPIKQVSAEFRKVVTKSEIPDVAVLWLEFESGLLGTLGTSFVSPGNASTGHAFFLNIYGDQANLYHDRFEGIRIFRKGSEIKEDVPYEEFRGYDYLAEEFRDFADAVNAKRSPEVSGEDGLHVLAVVHAAIRSSERNQPVSIEEVLQE